MIVCAIVSDCSDARVFIPFLRPAGVLGRCAGVMSDIDIIVSSTGNFNFNTVDHVREMRNNAFVGNTGQVDNEFDLGGSEGLEGMKVDNIVLQTTPSSFPLATG